MIEIETLDICGLAPAIHGMRNPMNSWDKSDSYFSYAFSHGEESYIVGDADRELAETLARNGPIHAKYRRMIVVFADILAPLYWWKEYDTYKVGTVANSCSTMHKIHAKEFTIDDFSHEHLSSVEFFEPSLLSSEEVLNEIVKCLNGARELYLQTKSKDYWWQMIQLLPSSYNQKRTVMLNYEVLSNIYKSRKNHKLDEWIQFCRWIEELPYAYEIIFPGDPGLTGNNEEET